MYIRNMMGVGVPAETAKAIAGSCDAAVAAAGSGISDATVLKAANNLVASGSGGVKVPETAEVGDRFHIGNGTSGTLAVFPHSSAAKINGGSAGAAVNVSQNKGITLTRVGPLDWIATVE
jgi:hypothetical protein